MTTNLEQAQVSRKPLGIKAYGSIPHLPGSATGPGDWTLQEEQARSLVAVRAHPYDLVIATEKLDGSNVAVARVGRDVLPLIRAGYRAEDSPHRQHHLFADWVRAREKLFCDLLLDGERLALEWLLMAHGTRYAIPGPDDLAVAFDILYARHVRRPWREVEARLREAPITTAGVVSYGPPLSTADAMAALGAHGRHGAIDAPEGAVWRLERKGQVRSVAKFVRPGHAPGRHLESVSGLPPVWNWDPEWV